MVTDLRWYRPQQAISLSITIGREEEQATGTVVV